MTKMLAAVRIYRDSPNTFGHESKDAQRRELKKLMGATASQIFLQDAINADLASGEYEDFSLGVRYLWVRLKGVEDVLREAEERYGEKIASRPYKTLPGAVHPVPSIALSIAQMEAKVS